MNVWIDGQPSRSASISVLDQTFLRGDGCFEAIRSYGGELFELDAHLDRLERSASALAMDLPPRTDLVAWLSTAAAESGDCVVRLIMTRGSETTPGRAVVMTHDLPDRPGGLELLTVQAPWHPAGQPWDLSGVKSVSYAPNMAASRVAHRQGRHDALLITGDGLILEGPTFSVGWVVGGVLETPSLDLGILDSITRRTVLSLAEDLGIDCAIRSDFPLSRIAMADEVMAWSTIKEVASVTAVDDQAFLAGPVTARLAEAFAALVSR